MEEGGWDKCFSFLILFSWSAERKVGGQLLAVKLHQHLSVGTIT